MKLIVGLGNPGKEYEGTRHNIGREVVRALAEDGSASWRINKKLHAEIAKLQEGPRLRSDNKKDMIMLALPITYMNNSGTAVKLLISNFKFQISNLLVVHDDLDLPLGTLRFTKGSGAAGQKGVQSIIDALGTKDFARLRIGVAGEHRATTDAASYVLKKFAANERTAVSKIKKTSVDALADYCTDGLAVAMNRYNKRSVLDG